MLTSFRALCTKISCLTSSSHHGTFLLDLDRPAAPHNKDARIVGDLISEPTRQMPAHALYAATVQTSLQTPSRSFAHALARKHEIEKLMDVHNYHGNFATHSGFDTEHFDSGVLKEVIYFHCAADSLSDTFKNDLGKLLSPYPVNILLSRKPAFTPISYSDLQLAGPQMDEVSSRERQENNFFYKQRSSYIQYVHADTVYK